eukprot:scaffold388_cov114-Cylindrotheca_fusiformis.AAC.8
MGFEPIDRCGWQADVQWRTYGIPCRKCKRGLTHNVVSDDDRLDRACSVFRSVAMGNSFVSFLSSCSLPFALPGHHQKPLTNYNI